MEPVGKNIKPGSALPSIAHEIDQDRINRWAELSGDFNRLHVDPQYAQTTRFKGTIAHGPMALAFLNQLMMACFAEGWARGGKLLEVRFLAPIRPGDRIILGGRAKEIKTVDGQPWADCRLAINKADGELAVTGRALARLEE